MSFCCSVWGVEMEGEGVGVKERLCNTLHYKTYCHITSQFKVQGRGGGSRCEAGRRGQYPVAIFGSEDGGGRGGGEREAV